MNSRYILVNGTILTMDERFSRHTAMAVENGRIVRVGAHPDIAPFMSMGWPVVDLDGQTVLPGFMDTHQHLGLTGQVLNGIDFQGTKSLETVFERIANAATSAQRDAWVLGYVLEDFALKEKRMPFKEELDVACADKPVMVVHCSWHLCSLNSKALEILDLPTDLPGMDLNEDGTPTGLVRDPGALSHVFPTVSKLTPKEVKIESFRKACQAALKQGITNLHCLEGGEFGPGDTRLVVENKDKLPLNTIVWNQVMDIEETLELGLTRIGGCICADGAISAHTAALLEPYTNAPDTCGTLNFTQDEMDSFVLEAHTKGLQVAIHCETDGSIEQVLRAMEKAIEAHPRDDHRHRIEHCEIPTLEQVERMGKAGIMAGMQPAFFPYLVDMDEYELIFGKERLRWIHPYRTMLDNGVIMCGGSDCPITPHGPLTGIQAAVLHPIEEERLTPEQAIRMFTLHGAYSGFEENERGSIEPGKIADLVILDQDPTKIAPEAISSINIVRTIVGGEPVDISSDIPA